MANWTMSYDQRGRIKWVEKPEETFDFPKRKKKTAVPASQAFSASKDVTTSTNITTFAGFMKGLPFVPLFSRPINDIPEHISDTIAHLNEMIPNRAYVISGGTARDIMLGLPPSDIDVCLKSEHRDLIKDLVHDEEHALALGHHEVSRRRRVTINNHFVDFIFTDDSFASNFDFTVNQIFLCPDLQVRASAQTWLDFDMRIMSQANKLSARGVLRALRLSAKCGFTLSDKLWNAMQDIVTNHPDHFTDRMMLVELNKAQENGVYNAFVGGLTRLNFKLPYPKSDYDLTNITTFPQLHTFLRGNKKFLAYTDDIGEYEEDED